MNDVEFFLQVAKAGAAFASPFVFDTSADADADEEEEENPDGSQSEDHQRGCVRRFFVPRRLMEGRKRGMRNLRINIFCFTCLFLFH